MKKESSMREIYNPHYLVRVASTTYNQASYIVDAMNGFTMQKTTFPFVCTIIDDASTDGEQEVIIQYLENNFEFEDRSIARNEETEDYRLLFARHKSNLNCYFAVLLLKYNHYSIGKLKPMVEDFADTKYVAICEGDDYWIDPYKLQSQVDFLELHPNHTICFCAYQEVFPDGSKNEVCRYNKDMEDCPMKDAILSGGGYMATASMLFKTEAIKDRPQWSTGLPVGDLPMMLVIMGRGKCGYLNKVMVAYRVTANGSWTNTMEADYLKKMRLYASINKMWKDYDVWTNKKYHNWVRIKTMRNNISMIHDKMRFFLKKITSVS